MPLLDDLPLDVLLIVLRDLTVDDIINLRKTCKSLHALTHARSVWHDALHLHLVSQSLPVPNVAERSIATLSSSELEDLTRRALRLRQNWLSAAPTPTKTFELHAVSSSNGQRPRVLALFPLPGRSNRYLISLTLVDQGARPRTYSIDCWDLTSPSPSSIANFQCSNLFSTAVNADPRHPHVFSITRKMGSGFQTENNLSSNSPLVTTVLGLDFTTPDPRAAFHPYNSFPSFKHSLLFKGSTFIATDASHHVRVIDTESGALQYILRTPMIHDDPTMQLDEYRCLNSYVMDDFVLVFRQQWIHLYHLPPVAHPAFVSANGEAQALELLPIAEHKWPWRIDTLTLRPQRSHPLLPQFAGDTKLDQDNSPQPLSLLLRFDSWFPWPVNILHQFILPPNLQYKPRTRVAAERDSSKHLSAHLPQLSLPYLVSSASFDGPMSSTSRASVECAASEPRLQPYMVTSLPSPLRIFTPSDTVLGGYGTALWLDAQDVAAPAQAGDQGQRVAGRVLQFVPPPPPPAKGEPETTVRHAVNLEANAENAPAEESTVAVFQLQGESDTWGKLALCDEEGRIAIGCTDGRILVYEYA